MSITLSYFFIILPFFIIFLHVNSSLTFPFRIEDKNCDCSHCGVYDHFCLDSCIRACRGDQLPMTIPSVLAKDDLEAECCESCACARSNPLQCECEDIKDHCHKSCNLCRCTRSIPPQCRCLDVKEYCSPRPCDGMFSINTDASTAESN